MDVMESALFLDLLLLLGVDNLADSTSHDVCGPCMFVVSTLQNFPDNHELQAKVLTVTTALAKASSDNIARLFEDGVCEPLAHSLDLLAVGSPVFVNACSAIMAVAVCENVAAGLGKAGATERALIAMGSPDSSIDIKTSALHCFLSLVEGSHETCKLSCNDQSLMTLQNLIILPEATLEVVATALASLDYLMKHKEHVDSDNSLGSSLCKVINGAMQRFPSHIKIIKPCLGIMVSIATSGPSNINQELIELGAPERLNLVMCEFARSNTSIYLLCCTIATSLSANSRECKLRLIAGDLIEMTVENWCIHFDDLEGDTRPCQLLITLAGGLHESVERIGASGAIAVVTATMRRHPGAVAVVVKGCMCLGLLAVVPGNAEQAGNVGACEVVVKCLDSVLVDKKASSFAVETMEVLATNFHGNSSRLGSCGACEGIVAYMRKFAHDIHSRILACRTMAALVKGDSQNAQILWDDTVLEEVASAIVMYPLRGDLFAAAMHLLTEAWSIATLECRRSIIDSGLPGAIVTGLSNLSLGEEGVLKGLDALENLARSDTGCCESLGEAGACDSIVSNALVYIDNHVVKRKIFKCIRALASCPANQTRLGDAGTGELVCKLWPDPSGSDATMQVELFDLVAVLMEEPGNRRRLVHANASKLIVCAMQFFQKDIEVQARGCLVLGTLQASDIDNTPEPDTIVGICRQTLDALVTLERAGVSANPALEAVRILSSHNDKVCLKMIELSAPTTLLSTMRSCEDDPKIQATGYVCLSNLLDTDPTIATDLLEANISNAVAKALMDFPQDTTLCYNSVQLINTLLQHSPASCESVGQSGICGALARSLKMHSSDRIIVATILPVIVTLSHFDVQNRSLFAREGACEAIASIWGMHDDHITQQLLVRATNLLLKDGHQNATKLGIAEGCPLLIEVWKASDSKDISAQLEFIEIVVVLLQDDDNTALKLTRFGAHDLILGCLKRFHDNRDVVINALGAIRGLVSGNGTHPEHLAINSVYAIIMDTLERFRDDIHLQTIITDLIALLASIQLENRVSLGTKGANALIVEIMKAYPDERSIQVACCRAIGHLSQECTDNVSTFVRMQAHVSVMRAMIVMPKDSRVQTDGLFAIAALSNTAQFAQRLGDLGACEVAMAAIKAFPNHLNTLFHGFEALSALGRGLYENKVRLGAAGACHLSVHALKTCADDTKVVSWSLNAIRLLADGVPTNTINFGNIRAAEHVLEAIRLQIGDMETVVKGFEALHALVHDKASMACLASCGACELAVQLISSQATGLKVKKAALKLTRALVADDTSVKRLTKARGATAILKTIKQLPRDKEIQSAGWSILAIMAATNSETSQQLGQEGACSSALQVFTTLPANAEVWGASCEALGALSQSCGRNKEELLIKNACQATLETLKKLMADAKASASAMYALTVLTAGRLPNYIKLQDLRACEIVMVAWNQFPVDPVIQARASKLVSVLASTSSSMKKRLDELGACERVILALKSFVDVEEVQSNGLYAAAILGDSDVVYHKVLVAGGIAFCLMSAFKGYPLSAEVQMRCCELTRVLTDNCGETSDRLSSLGVCGSMYNAMKAHTKDRKLQLSALMALCNICQNNGEDNGRFGALGVCELVVLLLEIFHTDADVSVELLKGAEALASNVENSRRLYQAGVCAGVIKTMQKFSRHLRLQACGSYVIWVLASCNLENRRELVELGCMDCVLNALNLLPDDGKTQAAGFYSMAIFTAADRAISGKADDVDSLCKLILNGLRTFPDDANFQAEGCYAMSLSTLARQDLRARLSAGGAFEIIGRALKKFPKDMAVQSKALSAVALLATGSTENHQRLIRTSICPLAVDALKQFNGKLAVQVPALQAIAVLADRNADYRSALSDAGACEQLMGLLKTTHGRAMTLFTLKATNELLRGNKTSQARMAQNNVGQLILKILKDLAMDREIQVMGMHALNSLMESEVCTNPKPTPAGSTPKSLIDKIEETDVVWQVNKNVITRMDAKGQGHHATMKFVGDVPIEQKVKN